MNPSDYICGGYAIVKSIPRPDYLDSPLLPERILSMSGCICESLPDTWAIRWCSPDVEHAGEFGLDADQLEALMNWTDAAFEDHRLRYPNVLSSPEVARDLAGQFLAGPDNVHIIGLGLLPEHADRFPTAPPTRCEDGTCCNIGLPGTYETLALRRPLADGGRLLGFELLGYMQDATPPCSWLCNSLHKPVAEALGITPNAAGFIDSQADAQAVADYCNRDDVPSEPVLWVPWAIFEYDLSA